MGNMVGQRIKERRKALKITQTQIQENTSISSGNLSCIENGKYLPSAVALVELSNILDCSIDWILTGKSSNSNNQNILDIEDSEIKKQLIYQFSALSEDDQEEILMMVQLKYNRTTKAREKEQKSSISELNNSTDEIA